MKYLSFTEGSWESLETLAKNTGHEDVSSLVRDMTMTYTTLLNMYRDQEGTDHTVEMRSKKWKLMRNSEYQTIALKSLLGLKND